jgi:hypothetical protein
MRYSLIGILAFGLPAIAGAASADTGSAIIYDVKRGDTLVELADKYLLRASDYRIVQKANGVVNPRFLPVGMKLRINRNLLKYQPAAARLVSVRGNVSIVRNGVSNAALTGTSIGEGTVLRTAGASFVTLQLDDGSRVSLPSNSDVHINRLRKYVLGSSIDYDFDLNRGSAHSKVAPLKSSNDQYRVRTPKAVSAVRGTDFQTRIEEGSGRDFAEVVEGGLAVGLSDGQNMLLPAGNGLSVAEDGKALTETLLPEPAIESAGKLQMRPKVRFDLPKSNQGMRISMASDAGFLDTIAEFTANTGVAEFDGIDDGNYFVRFRAISPNGFEGIPKTYAFKRRLNTVAGSAGKTDLGYVFKWAGEGRGTLRYHFQLIRNAKDATPMVDEAGLSVQQISLSDLPPGDYYWRVASIQYLDGEVSENWTDFEKLTVSAS